MITLDILLSVAAGAVAIILVYEAVEWLADRAARQEMDDADGR